MPEGFHPFPYRTRKLRPPGPMILGLQNPGKVGRRQVNARDYLLDGLFAFYYVKTLKCRFARGSTRSTLRREALLSRAAAPAKLSTGQFRIPNTEVKTSRADDTRVAEPWESRSSPGKMQETIFRWSLCFLLRKNFEM